MNIINPRSGTGIELKKGQKLKVIDLHGEQVADFFCYFKEDSQDGLSSGRTIDYLSRITFKEGDILYSTKSKPMVRILEDKVQRHDFLLTPCSKDTFKIIYKDKNPHHGCEGNLLKSFQLLGLELENIPTTFNIFMNVDLSPQGDITVKAPKSKEGDYIIFEALDDLLVGLTACSALQSNNGTFKPIGFELL